VIKQRCEWPYGESLISQAKRELATEEKVNTEAISRNLIEKRKIELPRPVLDESPKEDRTNTAEKAEIEQILHQATKIGGKAADSFLTQNVYYMLQIWQNSENVDLEKVLSDNSKIIAKKQTPENRQDTTKLAQREKSKDELSSINKSKESVISSKPSSPEQIVNTKHKTLSKSTIRHLRKLLNEAEETKGSSPSFIDIMIRKTLTGTEEGEPEVISHIPLLGSVTNSISTVKRSPRKPVGRATLGGVELTMTEHEAEEANLKFKLVLPEQEWDDEEIEDRLFGEISRPTTKPIKETVRELGPSSETMLNTSGTGSLLQESMKTAKARISVTSDVSIDITEDLNLIETVFALPVLVLECKCLELISKIQCRKKRD
jgi:hypothetical protein